MQGCNLTKAREIGAKVLRQGQEPSAPTDRPKWGPPAGLSSSGQLQSVLLQGGGDAAGSTAATIHSGSRIATPAPPAGSPARQLSVQFATPTSAGEDRAATNTAGRQRRAAFADTTVAADAAELSPHWYGTSSNSHETIGNITNTAAAAKDASIQELKNQIASLQSTLEQQLRPLAAASAANLSPWSQLLPAAAAAAAIMGTNPAGAIAAFANAGQHHLQQEQQQQTLGLIGVSGNAPNPWAGSVLHARQQQLGIGAAVVGASTDPELSAALSAHTRDMALLRMEVEKARGAAELQQIRAQLAALKLPVETAHLGDNQDVSDAGSAQGSHGAWELQPGLQDEASEGQEEPASMQHKVGTLICLLRWQKSCGI